MEMKMEQRKCLVCLSSLPNCQNRKQAGSNAESVSDCTAVTNQLQGVFLLRKLLKLPKNMCEGFLLKNGNPCQWVDCCASCSLFVERARSIFDRMLWLEVQFSQLQNLIQSSIAMSVKCHESSTFIGQTKGLKEVVRLYVSNEYNKYATSSATSSERIVTNSKSKHELLASRCNETPDIPHSYVEADISDPLGFEEGNFLEENDDMDDSLNDEEVNRQLGKETRKLLDSHYEPHQNNLDSINTPASMDQSSLILQHCHSEITIKEEPIDYVPENVIDHSSFAEPEQDCSKQKVYSYNVKYFSCSICKKRLKSLEKFKQHAGRHKGEKLFKCRRCRKSYVDLSHLEKHFNSKCHVGDDLCKCLRCGQLCSNFNLLKEHAKTHGEKCFVCPICKKSVDDLHRLMVHVKTHS